MTDKPSKINLNKNRPRTFRVCSACGISIGIDKITALLSRLCTTRSGQGGGPMLGLVWFPGLGGLKETEMFTPHPLVKVLWKASVTER